MNVHVSYKVHKTPDIEKEINQHVDKLRKRLQVFRPELIHLHATIDQNSAREGVAISLNLRLPSGQMASSGLGTTAIMALKTAFDDLQEQLSKHKDRLRAEHKRVHPRRVGRTEHGHSPRTMPPHVPFEQTLASVKLPTVSDADIRSYVNANLYRLIRFIDRELRYREANGQFRPGLISREEIVDETIVTAMGDTIEKPERLALEPWLYRLAMRAIDDMDMAQRSEEPELGVPLHQDTSQPNVQGSDEPTLQFYQPDETMLAEEQIADRATATPEQIAYSDEIVTLVEAALSNAPRHDREAFLLFAIEGFSPEEIAAISDRRPEQVHASIRAAREHLRTTLPVPNEFKDKLREKTKIA